MKVINACKSVYYSYEVHLTEKSVGKFKKIRVQVRIRQHSLAHYCKFTFERDEMGLNEESGSGKRDGQTN